MSRPGTSGSSGRGGAGFSVGLGDTASSPPRGGFKRALESVERKVAEHSDDLEGIHRAMGEAGSDVEGLLTKLRNDMLTAIADTRLEMLNRVSARLGSARTRRRAPPPPPPTRIRFGGACVRVNAPMLTCVSRSVRCTIPPSLPPPPWARCRSSLHQMDEMDLRITRLDKALTEQKGVQGILAQQTKDSHKRILEMGEQLHELNTELMGTPSDDEE